MTASLLLQNLKHKTEELSFSVSLSVLIQRHNFSKNLHHSFTQTMLNELSRGQQTLVYCSTVNIRFLVTIFKDGTEDIFLQFTDIHYIL